MLVVYLIVKQGKGENQRTYWNRAGAAFVNRDGSINVKIDILPNVNFQIREAQPNDSRED